MADGPRDAVIFVMLLWMVGAFVVGFMVGNWWGGL